VPAYFLPLGPTSWALAGIAAAVVGMSKAGFGSGAGILAVPLMASVLTPPQMLAVMLPVLICGDIFSIIQYPRERDTRNLAVLVPGAVFGVVLGTWALDWFLDLRQGDLWLRRCIGAICVVFIAIQLRRLLSRDSTDAPDAKPYRPRVWHGVGLGTVAGLTSTLAHAAGPLIALFLLPQRLDKRVFVGTCVTYFFLANMAKFLPYFYKGLMTRQALLTSLVLLPAVVLGTLLGSWLNRKLDARVFACVIHAIALVLGVKLLLA